MSSLSSRAPELLETGFAKTYQVLPSASLMAEQFDSLFAAREHLEQSLTAEQPSFSRLIDARPGAMSTSETLRNMYGENNVVRLKRTARALASLSVSEDDEENFVTSDKLPSIASPLVLSVGASQTKLQALPIMQAPARRRNLLPAPKTNMLPVSSPTELRALIKDSHSKRQEQISYRKTRQGMQSASRLNQKSCHGLSGIWQNLKALAAKPLRQISNLLDQLALA
jgi:hypothetical protein